jgi:hypothetical protein
MTETVTKSVKWMIVAISIYMFCYQTEVAVKKLIDPPVVDNTEVYNIKDIELPLITICATDQINQTKMDELGYWIQDGYPTIYFLAGLDFERNVISWGSQHNMTFADLVKEVIKLQPNVPYILTDLYANDIESTLKFYPKFGLCVDVDNYVLSSTGAFNLRIGVYWKELFQPNCRVRVYLTDKKLKTMSTIHTPSHKGSSIILENDWKYDYMIEVQQMSYLDPRNPDECKEYNDGEFDKCVDEGLQILFKEEINCNPPWLSLQEKCSAVINSSDKAMGNLYEKVQKTLEATIKMETFPAKENCKKFCSMTQQTIILSEKEAVADWETGWIFLSLKFDELVLNRTKRLAYGFSDFLIDIGSSLGLWFGLSVFGITDLGIEAFQWLKKKKGEAKRMLLM